MIRADCLYYKGEVPCLFHKKYKIECNEKCNYYKKIGLRILIIKKDALGDVLRTTPILYSIKKKYGKDTHITWLTDPSAYDLLKFNPLIDRTYIFDFKTLIHLEIERFDILFNLDKDLPALALAKKVKAKKKFGFTMNKFGNLITFNKAGQYAHRLGISDNIKKDNKKTYQEIICELLELPYLKEFKHILQIPNKEELSNKLSVKNNINRIFPIIGFITGAGPKYLTKMWPKDYFVELGVRLIKEKNFAVLLFGTELEKEINKFIFDKIKSVLPENLKSRIIDTGINNTLLEYAALISLTEVVITGDTLGLHLAIALDVPSISFFGPTSSSEIDLFDTGIKIIADSPCLLCYKQECDYSTFCLSNIKPKFVFEKVIDLLEKK